MTRTHFRSERFEKSGAAARSGPLRVPSVARFQVMPILRAARRYRVSAPAPRRPSRAVRSPRARVFCVARLLPLRGGGGGSPRAALRAWRRRCTGAVCLAGFAFPVLRAMDRSIAPPPSLSALLAVPLCSGPGPGVLLPPRCWQTQVEGAERRTLPVGRALRCSSTSTRKLPFQMASSSAAASGTRSRCPLPCLSRALVSALVP